MNKRRNQSKWQRLIDEQAASGLTQKAYCEQAGIALATFGYWKRKLQAGVSPTPAGSGREAVSVDDWIELLTQGLASDRGWQIELEPGNGLCLRLRQG